MKKIILVLCIVSAASFAANAQLSNTDKISQVYGSFASQLNPEQLSWINNCLSRCQIIEAADLPQGVTTKVLSTVSLQKKFVDVQPDATYNSQTFNPLKYNINFFNKADQYFTIDNTSKVLKVAKKEN